MLAAEPRDFNLERFYFGNLVLDDGRTSSKAGVLARTPGIGLEQVTECLRVAPIAPPDDGQRSQQMPGALGLFRAETLDFVVATAQRTAAGCAQILCVIVPAAALRQLGGNILAFRPLAMMDMPAFAAVRPGLPPFELTRPAPLPVDAQADSLLDLLDFCGDSTRNVEALLAAVIHGRTLRVIGAPASVDTRLRFVQGLLNLLPVPARIGITFATHVPDDQSSPAQIQFANGAGRSGQHVEYDWAAGTLLAPSVDDAYSHYIVAQLRLDPGRVVELTAQMARTAVWRAMQRDPLPAALAWVARRSAVDEAVSLGQPADRGTVGQILREDPTLPADLRRAYARHLLAFALSLDEPDSADAVPAACGANPEIAQAVASQLYAAAQGGKSETAFALLERWLLRVPEAAALKWHNLLHAVAQIRLNALLQDGAVEPLIEFLNRVADSPAALQYETVFGSLVQAMLPAAYRSPDLAQALFVSAARGLSPGAMCELIGDDQLVAQLPSPLQAALASLGQPPGNPAPPGVLDQGAKAFGPARHPQVLTRLVECAVLSHRPELVDTRALQTMLEDTKSSAPERMQPVVQQIIQELAYAPLINLLEPPGPRVLAQLLLTVGDYARTITLLEFYQNEVYGADRQEVFARLAGDLFASTALRQEALADALEMLEGSQIRPMPRALIYARALESQQWADSQEDAARRLTSMLFGDHNLANLVGQQAALRLLEFHARHRNSLDALRVAAALVEAAQPSGLASAATVAAMWPILTWDQPMRDAGLELLRRFVRGVPRSDMIPVAKRLGHDLGPSLGQALQATCLLRALTADRTFVEFVEGVHTTAALLVDIGAVFHAGRDLPPNHRLRRDLDTLTGGLSDTEREEVAANTFEMARCLLALGSGGKRGRAEKVAAGTLAPANVLDVLTFIGGHLGAVSLTPLDLRREEIGHLFGTRSAAMVHRETAQAAVVLRALQDAAALVTPEAAAALPGEVDSLWSSLSATEQRRLEAQFAGDCQMLAQVIMVVAKGGTDRLVSDSGVGHKLEIGRRQPRTGLEAIRWVSGYFARKHQRKRFW